MGTARTPEEAATPTIVEVQGVKVALLSYTFGFNGLPYPNGETWRAGKLKVPATPETL
jgi:poly-gamma-glutamate synthesis protein (capsule biosynthesis protein)